MLRRFSSPEERAATIEAEFQEPDRPMTDLLKPVYWLWVQPQPTTRQGSVVYLSVVVLQNPSVTHGNRSSLKIPPHFCAFSVEVNSTWDRPF